ncbi:MAG: zeta toxin family protein [bacterium]|nr:zeta toxin family protein [bacterium]
MELTDQEKKIQEEAIREIKLRKQEFIEKFIISKKPLRLSVISFFMAGSPGAGKTEFSKHYMSDVLDKTDEKLVRFLVKKGVDIESVDTLFIRIDVDEIREFFPQYQKTDVEKGIKGNAHVIQKAANRGLDMMREYCFKNDISFLQDGTFGNYETMRRMVEKSLKTEREVQIFYIYLDPLVAWEFTKAREYLEGRNIVKEKFIEQFFSSRENVDKIKGEFGNRVKIHCVIKNSKNEVEVSRLDIQSVDSFLKIHYNDGSIKEYLADDLQNLISEL